ncbi:MAG: electron transfer flavoprotein subunit alpha/FixB family protein [Magnetococcales bacterium]|nr:electron transfer flavoprotein subunit alpha/FixB family protein [Magnetococcales bacterium]
MTKPLVCARIVRTQNGAVHFSPTLDRLWKAASELGQPELLLLGNDLKLLERQAEGISGYSKVLIACTETGQALQVEMAAAVVSSLVKEHSSAEWSHILAETDSFGRELMAHLAARMMTALVTEVIAIEDANTFIRPVHAGVIQETVRVSQRDGEDELPVLITIRPTGFPVSDDLIQPTAPDSIQRLDTLSDNERVRVIDEHASPVADQDLTSAQVVVGIGGGVGDKEGVALIEQLANHLGGAIAATRTAVDSGLVSNDLQVGQTGRIIAPKLYFAIGISGAIQHLAGIKDAGAIVSINSDPNAPIHAAADLALAADLRQAIPELIAHISQRSETVLLDR